MTNLRKLFCFNRLTINRQEPDRKETVMIMDMAISNLIHKDVWKTKMKAPQYAEPSSARDDDYQPPQKKRKEG